MEPTVDCIPCFINQVLDMQDSLALENDTRDEIVDCALDESRKIMQGQPTPLAMRNVMEKINYLSGCQDPYLEFKKESTRAALEILPRLREIVEESADPFARAVEFSVAGNAIDLAVMDKGDLEGIVQKLKELEKSEFAIDHTAQLADELADAGSILIIGDNAGEIVFDRLIIEQLELPEIYYGVRGFPILNDATEAEARAAGIDEQARLINTGQRVPGVVLAEADDEFREVFNRADVVIAKGQGSFETLVDIPRPVYHLFKVKCAVVAEQVGSEVGKFMVWKRKVNN
ncbi:MAG: damage-control phosphatase ARMT1 family protein [bacterium]